MIPSHFLSSVSFITAVSFQCRTFTTLQPKFTLRLLKNIGFVVGVNETAFYFSHTGSSLLVYTCMLVYPEKAFLTKSHIVQTDLKLTLSLRMTFNFDYPEC